MKSRVRIPLGASTVFLASTVERQASVADHEKSAVVVIFYIVKLPKKDTARLGVFFLLYKNLEGARAVARARNSCQ